jgi:hypothetical protein
VTIFGGAPEMRTIRQSHQIAQFPNCHCRWSAS